MWTLKYLKKKYFHIILVTSTQTLICQDGPLPLGAGTG